MARESTRVVPWNPCLNLADEIGAAVHTAKVKSAPPIRAHLPKLATRGLDNPLPKLTGRWGRTARPSHYSSAAGGALPRGRPWLPVPIRVYSRRFGVVLLLRSRSGPEYPSRNRKPVENGGLNRQGRVGKAPGAAGVRGVAIDGLPDDGRSQVRRALENIGLPWRPRSTPGAERSRSGGLARKKMGCSQRSPPPRSWDCFLGRGDAFSRHSAIAGPPKQPVDDHPG